MKNTDLAKLLVRSALILEAEEGEQPISPETAPPPPPEEKEDPEKAQTNFKRAIGYLDNEALFKAPWYGYICGTCQFMEIKSGQDGKCMREKSDEKKQFEVKTYGCCNAWKLKEGDRNAWISVKGAGAAQQETKETPPPPEEEIPVEEPKEIPEEAPPKEPPKAPPPAKEKQPAPTTSVPADKEEKKQLPDNKNAFK